MDLAAEHSRYTCRAQPLDEREEIVVQIPPAAGQGYMHRKSDDEFHGQAAVHCCQLGCGRGLGVAEEVAQPDLTWTPGTVPAGQLRLDSQLRSARRAAVQHGHALI